MSEPASHKTRTTALLASLTNPGQGAVWREFDARFRPVLRAFALKAGLYRTGAEEAARMTLVEFRASYRAGRYDRSKGRLSCWIIGIACHQITKRARFQGRAEEHRGDSALRQLHGLAQGTRLCAAHRRRRWMCSSSRARPGQLTDSDLPSRVADAARRWAVGHKRGPKDKK